MIVAFVWTTREGQCCHGIKEKILVLPRDCGGLGLIDITSQAQALGILDCSVDFVANQPPFLDLNTLQE
jgi:hypothetical protein